jgi:hypothetical protein
MWFHKAWSHSHLGTGDIAMSKNVSVFTELGLFIAEIKNKPINEIAFSHFPFQC